MSEFPKERMQQLIQAQTAGRVWRDRFVYLDDVIYKLDGWSEPRAKISILNEEQRVALATMPGLAKAVEALKVLRGYAQKQEIAQEHAEAAAEKGP